MTISAAVANLLNRYPRIAYAGPAAIIDVAVDLIRRGAHEFGPAI